MYVQNNDDSLFKCCIVFISFTYTVVFFTHSLIFEVLISDKLNRNIQLGRCFIVGFVAGKVKLLYLGSWFVKQGTWTSLIKVIVEIKQPPRKREREREREADRYRLQTGLQDCRAGSDQNHIFRKIENLSMKPILTINVVSHQ